MTITVQVSDFRKNMAMYLGKLEAGHKIKLKKGNVYQGTIMPSANETKINNMAANVLKDIDRVREKINLSTKAKTFEELNNEIDRILYGADRNGKTLSD
ncbi:MAG: hypothetical protein ACD_72C00412G0003 [uncultured bacterium]|nr:MAG: hypothetical protein ACD_72C00412G0003 [uncultured bacterium]